MRGEPTEAELSKLCEWRSTDYLAWQEVPIGMHFFVGEKHWYAAEYDPKDRSIFGYFVDDQNRAETGWDYTFLDDLKSFEDVRGREVTRNLDWRPCLAGTIERIAKAHRSEKKNLENT